MSGILLAILGFAISVVTGWLIVTTLDPRRPSAPGRVLQWSFAAIVGSFVHGAAYLLWASALREWPAVFWAVDLLPLAGAAIVWGRWRPDPVVSLPPPRERLDPIACAAAVAFGLALIAATLGAVQQSIARPQGLWDAWMMWNFRARMLFLAPPHLADLYVYPFAHPDYPLGLPLTIARLWRYAGSDPAWVPQTVGVACTLLIGVTVAAAATLLRGGRIGWIAGTLCFGSVFLIRQGSSQYADHPLALAMLASAAAAALWLHEPSPRPRHLALLGLLLGSAAWTKNEGLLFLALSAPILLAGTLIPNRRGAGSEVAYLVIGLLPAVLFIVIHRALTPEGTGLFRTMDPATMWHHATDPHRYGLIHRGFRAAGDTAADRIAASCAALASLLWIEPRPPGTRLALAVVGTMVLGQATAYLLVYLLLSNELSLHLYTSADRLALHLWPLVLLLFVLCMPRWEPTPSAHE